MILILCVCVNIYDILFLVIKKLSACELPMFELCFNVSLVLILFEYILLFSMHDMTDSFVIYKYCWDF